MSNEVIYGRNSVRDTLRANNVTKLFLAQNLTNSEFVTLAKAHNVPYEFVSGNKLNDLTNSKNHQGVVALMRAYVYTKLNTLIKKASKKENPLIIMMAEVQDPHNLGAIIRIADAFSVDGIIIQKHRQVQMNASVIKVATGAHNYVPVVQVTNLNQTAKKLKDAGYWLVGSDANAPDNYLDLKYDFPCVLVVGAEGRGIPPLLASNCDLMVQIPQSGHVNSLNVSVATGILIAGIRGKQN